MRTAVQLGFNGHGVFGRRPTTDLDGVLGLAADAGFDGVEPMGDVAGAPGAAALLRRSRLRVPVLHLFLADVADPGDRRRWTDVLGGLDCPALALSAFGMEQSADGYHRLADDLGAVREDVRRAGADLMFHPHDAEMSVVADDGRRGTDVLTGDLPDLRLIVDAYWATRAGLDPAEAISRNAARSGYYHLKDGDASGGTEFGRGTVPMRACLRAAAAAGPGGWVVLEQEKPATDAPGVLRRFQRAVADVMQESPT
ncbi:sugar phosphate isomerase/epimerase family protein [Nocardiopsis trehalosi]|uniref:sugar phosphate isomerase/epimerase family protein n=1 Tax=Nocardiopsis trehalosi TaxID=109329 RepID=UPI0008315235|nr:sugar phosphate isomerase/epimerase [Nocardiopsis trehalosi]